MNISNCSGNSTVYIEPRSICQTDLSDAFLSRITRDVKNSLQNQKKIESGLRVEVVTVYGNKQSFIDNYLEQLYINKQGTFCKLRSFGNRRPNLYVYDCERSCFSKGNSTGDPTKTRANGCRAFISFSFETGAMSTVCVLRYRLMHFGHNPANRDENKVNRIDTRLKSCIQEWAMEIDNMPDILAKISKWNKIKCNMDFKDRRFFPTYQEIQHMVERTKNSIDNTGFHLKVMKKSQVAFGPVDNISTLLKTKYKDMCVYYHPATYTSTTCKPMILILQTTHQKEVYSLHGQKLVFISKNFEGLRSYGSAVYSMVVKDEKEVAYPIGYILSSSDEPSVFVQALHKFHIINKVQPNAFFIDKGIMAACDGIIAVYPSSKIFVPQYQVMKSIHKWLSMSAVGDIQHKDVREVLLKYVLDLSRCTTEENFFLGVKELEEKVDYPEFNAMLKSEWLPYGQRWSEFGRGNYFPNSETSLIAERLFLNLEHQLLKGLQSLNKVEDLVKHIARDLNQGTDNEGMINMEYFLEGTPEEQAENHYQEGWGNNVQWVSEFEAMIPTNASMKRVYVTNMITMECECPSPPYKGLCMHLYLGKILVQKRVEESGAESLESARSRIANEAYANSDYLLDTYSCSTFHSGIVCVTSLSEVSCTCKASFFGCECVGVSVLKMVNSPEHSIEDEEPKDMIELVGCDVQEEASDAETLTAVNSPETMLVDEESSSKKMIESLYLWSQSQYYNDSKEIHGKLLDLMKTSHCQVPLTEVTENISNQHYTCGDSLQVFTTVENSNKERDLVAPYITNKRTHGKITQSKESPKKCAKISKTLLRHR